MDINFKFHRKLLFLTYFGNIFMSLISFLLVMQGVKRLMTCCQRYFTTDPSRCVNYEGEIH